MISEDENVLVQAPGMSQRWAAAMQNQGVTLIQNLCRRCLGIAGPLQRYVDRW